MDLEQLIGTTCWAEISHEAKPDGRVFAKIDSIRTLKANDTPLEASYKRAAVTKQAVSDGPEPF